MTQPRSTRNGMHWFNACVVSFKAALKDQCNKFMHLLWLHSSTSPALRLHQLLFYPVSGDKGDSSLCNQYYNRNVEMSKVDTVFFRENYH